MSIFLKGVKSPVRQDLIWCAEYSDGSVMTEFDLDTQKPNNLGDIKKDSVIRFGLLGIDVPIYFETFGGNFNVAGRGITLIYREKGKDYHLIGRPIMYNRFIYFKRGIAELDLTGGRRKKVIGWGKPEGQITEYTVGHANKFEIDGVTFDLQSTVTVPYQQPVYMTFKLGADREMDGVLVVVRNGEEIHSVKAPLDKEMGGETHWTVI